MPVRRLGGPAPQRELRVEQHVGGLPDQRPVIDQHRGRARLQLGEATPRVLQPCGAPRVERRVRGRGDEELVRRHHVALAGERQPVRLGRRALRQERIVVQQEHRHQGDGTVGAGPLRERILGRQHAQRPAQGDQVVVPGLTVHLHGILDGGPQFVVSRHPDHRVEPAREQRQRPLDVVGLLRHVTRDDQPVLGRRGHDGLRDLTVAPVPDMDVADRPECRGLYFRLLRHLITVLRSSYGRRP